MPCQCFYTPDKTRTIKTQAINRIEAFEMLAYERLLKIPGLDRLTNEEVPNRMDRNRQLLPATKSYKL